MVVSAACPSLPQRWEQSDVLRQDPTRGCAGGSGEGLLLSRRGEHSSQEHPCQECTDALQMLPRLLTKAEIDTINKLFAKFLREGTPPD